MVLFHGCEKDMTGVHECEKNLKYLAFLKLTTYNSNDIEWRLSWTKENE